MHKKQVQNIAIALLPENYTATGRKRRPLACYHTGAQARFQSLGVQFLGLKYHCPSPEKQFRNVYPVWRSLLPPPDLRQKAT